MSNLINKFTGKVLTDVNIVVQVERFYAFGKPKKLFDVDQFSSIEELTMFYKDEKSKKRMTSSQNTRLLIFIFELALLISNSVALASDIVNGRSTWWLYTVCVGVTLTVTILAFISLVKNWDL